MSDTQHALIAPSSLHRLIRCTGSLALTAMYPEREDSPAAMEGTAAHWVLAELLEGRKVVEGALAPNGIAITDEMIESAELCADTVPTRMLLPASPMRVEKRIDIPRIHDECWGTPDLWYYMDGTLYVTDYKFGREFVDVRDNEQLIAYAVAALDLLKLNDQLTPVEMCIVQPRNYHRDGTVRKWTVMGHELRASVNIIKAGVERALSDHATCIAGSHCSHCSATHACEALQKSTQSVFDFLSAPAPSEMSPTAKGLYKRQVEQAMVLLKSINGGLEEEIEDSIRRGVPVPGYDLQPGQGKTVWNKQLDEVVQLGDMLGSDFRKNGVITPIQAAAKLKKIGIDDGVISGYSDRQSGALKLVASDMKQFSRIFGNQKGVSNV